MSSSTLTRRSSGRLHYGFKIAGLFALYFATARFGLKVNAVGGFATLIWPPSGISLAALLVLGLRYWPGIALGAFAVNLSIGASVPVALGICVGNALEAVVAALLLGRLGFRGSLERLQDVFGLVLAAALFSTLIGATVGVTSLSLGGAIAPAALHATWRAWWLGDMLGVLVFGSFLLVWSFKPRLSGGRARLAEAIALLGATGLGALFIFSDLVVDGASLLLRPFAVYPFLMIVAVRLGQRGAVTGMLLVSCVALGATALGHGRFWPGSLEESLLQAQVFLAVAAISKLVLAAAVSELRREKNALGESNSRLEGLLAARRREESDQRFLAEATERLYSSIEFQETLRHVAGACVPHLADWCIVHVLDPETRRFTAIEWVDALPDASRSRVLGEYVQRYLSDLDSTRFIPQTFETRAPRVAAFAGDDYGDYALDPERARMLRELAPKGLLSVPLFLRGRALGALSIASVARHYDAADVQLMQELARRAAIALDNARLYDEARDAVYSRDEFLSIASHELKTPLTTLSLQLQLFGRVLKRSLGEPGSTDADTVAVPVRMARGIAGLESQSARLTSLLDELLDLSRIRLGRMRLDRESMDLGEVARETVERFRTEAALKGMPIAFHSAGAAVGSWDWMRLEQVVSNLLSNALKYGEGRPVTVLVEPDAARSRARLRVRDGGKGISAEMRERIFQRFERGGVNEREVEGLGLGLYIARQIVEAHGGTIRVESEPGQGSTFIVEVPLQNLA